MATLTLAILPPNTCSAWNLPEIQVPFCSLPSVIKGGIVVLYTSCIGCGRGRAHRRNFEPARRAGVSRAYQICDAEPGPDGIYAILREISDGVPDPATISRRVH